MRLLVTGGRDYDDRAAAFRRLDEIHATSPITVLVHGDARGLDRTARDWARSRGVAVDENPADWTASPRGAGAIRNRDMIAKGADMVLVFPGGPGTKDCARAAEKAGLRVEPADAGMGAWWRKPEPAQGSFNF
jgi:hypothetical protein